MSFLAKSGLLLANVNDYGAKGDGVTDDTAAVQAAIDDVIANSVLGGVFFPPGNFQVSLTGLAIVAASNFRMLGAGQDVSKLQFIAEDQGGAARTLVALSGGCSFVEISGVDLDGNQANLINADTQSILLNTGDTSDLEVFDCITQNSAGRVIVGGDDTTQAERLSFRDLRMPGNLLGQKFEFTATSEVFVERCFSENDGGADGPGFLSLLETTPGPLQNSNIFIRDNYYDGGNGSDGWDGIYIRECFSCEIHRNTIRGGSGETLANSAINVDASVNGVFDLDIRDNHLSGSFQFSVVMTPEDGNINRFNIVGNECSDDIRFLPGATGAFAHSPRVSGNWGFGAGVTAADYANLPNLAVVAGGVFNDGQGGTLFGCTQWVGGVVPEGAVVGNVGDIFQNWAGGNGSTFYIKETGGGNVGWSAIGDSGAKDLFIIAPSQSPQTQGDHIGSNVGVNGSGNIEFHVPDNFHTLVHAQVLVIAGGTLAAADIDLNSNYGSVNELFNANSESDVASTFALVVNQINEIDASSVLTGIAADDTVGLELSNNNVTGGYLILGMHLKYI